MGSGVSGLALSWVEEQSFRISLTLLTSVLKVLGRRREQELINFRPHHIANVGLGTFLLWFGWLGFNGGSAFGANLRAIMAIWNSMIAAAFGGLTW